jgi:hypothetical protein
MKKITVANISQVIHNSNYTQKIQKNTKLTQNFCVQKCLILRHLTLQIQKNRKKSLLFYILQHYALCIMHLLFITLLLIYYFTFLKKQ